MAVNRFEPHILFLAEDSANSDILNGIQLSVPFNKQRQMQILPACGGWIKVKRKFEDNYIAYLRNNSTGYVVLVVDFDRDENRAEEIRKSVPVDVQDRVFVFGAWEEPEKIKLGILEDVGKKLAEDCKSGTNDTWKLEAFGHNAIELARFRKAACEILF